MCDTSWDDTDEGRQAGWDRFLHAPAPVGYDPTDHPAVDVADRPGVRGVAAAADARLRVMPGSLMTAGIGAPLTWRHA